MDYIGLLLELLFFTLGVYVYLFAIGRIKMKEPGRSQAEEFRQKNGWWLRLISLLLIAIMFVNIVLHLREMFSPV